METPLSLAQTAELAALQRLADSARLRPESPSWTRWLDLIALRDHSTPIPDRSPASTSTSTSTSAISHTEPSAPSPSPVTGDLTPSPARTLTDRELGQFYLPDATPHARIKYITRIRNTARATGIPAPLHHPSAMLGWFETMRTRGHYTRGCPRPFIDAAARHPHPLGQALVTPAPVTAPVPVPVTVAPTIAENPGATQPGPSPGTAAPIAAPVPVPDITEAATEPAAVLRRLEETEYLLAVQLQQSRERLDDPTATEAIRRRHSEAAAAVAKQRAHLEKHGQLIPVATATAAFLRIIHPLPGDLQRTMIAHPPEKDEPWPAAVTRIIRTAFANIQSTFQQQLNPSAA